MRATITAICFLLFMGSHLLHAAAKPQQQFEKANELFRQKQYSEAAGIYQQLITEGYQQPELLVNAGNAWYKANRTGMAIYNYEKALEIDPFNRSAAHNLSLANQRVEGYTSELPLLFFQQWWLQLQHMHHPNGWAAGAVIFFWLLIAGIIASLLVPAFKPAIVRWITVAAGILFLFYLGMGIGAVASANSHDTGIVMNSVVKVKAAPDENSKDIFELHEGIKVQVTDATREFCKIVLTDGKSGWLACAAIKRL